MSHTVKANSRPVCTKGTGDEAVADKDECKTDDGETVTPVNVAYTENLETGKTTTSFIQQQPVWTENGLLDGADSDPEHDGTDGGVNSGTYRGWCQATSFSPDVLFEGGGVVRIEDTTLQNSGNCEGIVKPAGMGAAAIAAAAKAAEEAAAAAAAAKRKALENDESPDGAKQDDADQEDAKPPTDPEQQLEQCAIEHARIEDSNGRGVDDQGTLSIVPSRSGETITCTGELAGICPEEPIWKVQGHHNHEAAAAVTTFHAKASWAPSATTWLADYSPPKSNVSFTSAKDSRSFTISTYPPDKLTWMLTTPKWLSEIVKHTSDFFDKLVKGKFAFVGPVASGKAHAQWTEIEGSPDVYYHYSFEFGAFPLLEIAARVTLTLLPTVPYPIRKYVGDMGVFIELKGRCTFMLQIERPNPGKPTVWQFEGKKEVLISAGIEAFFCHDDVLYAELAARTSMKVIGNLIMLGQNPGIALQVAVGGLEGYYEIKVFWKVFVKRGSWTIFEAFQVPSTPQPIDLTKIFS